jgi:hypothetical protein
MLVLLIAVAAAGGVVLLALVIALLVQLRRVSITVAALDRELAPLLAQIREDAERARTRVEELSERYGPPDEPSGVGSVPIRQR